MHKALIPMVASLALCGAVTAELLMSSASAQPSGRTPMMVAAATDNAANATPDNGPPPRNLSADGRRRRGPLNADRVKQFCSDLYARQTGELAYQEARLELTPSQQPLFQRWKDARLAIARRKANSCAQMPQRHAAAEKTRTNDRQARPGPADRMAREETMLKQRLADIEAERPAMEALYNALSPTQKMALAGPRGRMGGMRRFADAMGPRGPMGMGPGPMRQGPMGPGPEPMAPPPER